MVPVGVLADGRPVDNGTDIVLSIEGEGDTADYQKAEWSADVVGKAEEAMAKMTDKQIVGQVFILKHGDSGDMSPWVEKYEPGGFVFSSEDWGADKSASEIKSYVGKFQARSYIPLIAAVDQEGGKVCRLADTPSQAELASQGREAVLQDGIDKSVLLSGHGMNLDLAPVADICGEQDSYINYRTYQVGLQETAGMVSSAVEGIERDGVGSCLKHFPGYGDAADSHQGSGSGYAGTDVSRDGLVSRDLVPFRAGVDAGCGMVMVNHVVYPMSGGVSASVSGDVYSMLREELGNDVVAITDSLSMKVRLPDGDGDAHGMECLRALEAGADLVMTKEPDLQYGYVWDKYNADAAFKGRVREACLRVLCWKAERGILVPELLDADKIFVSNEADLRAALSGKNRAAAGDVKHIMLTKDIEIVGNRTDNKVPAGGQVVLDLCGYEMKTFTGSNYDSMKAAFELSGTAGSGNRSVFTIRNGRITGPGKPYRRSFVTVGGNDWDMVFDHVEVSGFDNSLRNTSMDRNGCIAYVIGKGCVVNVVNDSWFHDIRANGDGGVAYFKLGGSGNEFYAADSVFLDCGAARAGGVVWMEGDKVLLENCRFEDCSAGTEGGVVRAAGSVVDAASSVFLNCSAVKDGGVIHAARSVVDVSGSMFTECSAGGRGGAVFGTGGGSRMAVRDGCGFVGCTAGTMGGAVHASYGTLEVRGSEFEGCHAGRGGAVCSFNDMKLGSTDKWSDIWGRELGDGLGKDDAKPSDLAGLPADLYWETRISDTSFLDCYADGPGEGGAVWTENKYSLFEGVTVDGGGSRGIRSTGNGGGIYVSKDGRAVLRAAAPGVDGGTSARPCVIKDCATSSSKPGNESQTRNGGGGIFSNGDLYLMDTDITGCTSEGAGGGLLWQSDDAGHVMKMTGCTVNGNYARNGEGGGMFLGCGREGGEGKAYIARSEIKENRTDTTAHWGGGGMFLRHNCHLYMSRAVVVRNTADGLGGGIAGCPTSHTLVYTMADASVAGNTAKGAVKPSNVSDKYDIDAEGGSVLYPHAQDFFCINEGGVTGGKWASGWSADDRLDPTGGQAVPASLLNGGGLIECGETGWLGLTSALDPDAYVVVDECAVVIEGNHSAMNGGGIGCNGSIDVYTSDGVVPGFVMPDTGGSGAVVYTVTGLALAGAAAVLLLCKKIGRRKDGCIR